MIKQTMSRMLSFSLYVVAAASILLIPSFNDALLIPSLVSGVTSARGCRNIHHRNAIFHASQNSDWISLTDDSAVQKRILKEGSGERAKTGNVVEIDYVGTLGEIDWDVQGVVDCWLMSQQGLDGLQDGFRNANIDAKKLLDDSFFTESFLSEALGVSNKIQAKKTIMAAKRLSKITEEYPSGTKFDSNRDGRDVSFKFTLGQGKTIKAMELVVGSMREGERVEMKCRADYAYGSEGLRKRNGDVVVPSYATLCFDITLLTCS